MAVHLFRRGVHKLLLGRCHGRESTMMMECARGWTEGAAEGLSHAPASVVVEHILMLD